MVSAPVSNLSPEKGRNSISRLAADKTIINNNSENANPIPMIIQPQVLQNLQVAKFQENPSNEMMFT